MIKIEDTSGLTIRAQKVLRRMNVKTIHELARKSTTEILLQKNCGETTYRELKALLARHGLYFTDADPHEREAATDFIPDLEGVRLQLREQTVILRRILEVLERKES